MNCKVATQLQLCYNYTHDVILTSLIVIHILKLDIMKFFGHNVFLKYWYALSIMIVNDGPKYDMWHNNFLPHGILIVFWKNKK
jgi:hypothetical protein